ncbi:MAG: hypothetical protein JO212_09520 [Acetobacteraceae bacterium]|nr:hypothetical protein [Acetobacteraceae bacterium]
MWLDGPKQHLFNPYDFLQHSVSLFTAVTSDAGGQIQYFSLFRAVNPGGFGFGKRQRSLLDHQTTGAIRSKSEVTNKWPTWGRGLIGNVLFN